MQALLAYPYPGNIREPENILGRGILLADGETIVLSNLPSGLKGITPPGKIADIKRASKESAIRTEQAMKVKALEETNGNIRHPVKRFGVSPQEIQTKMKEYGLRKASSETRTKTGRKQDSPP